MGVQANLVRTLSSPILPSESRRLFHFTSYPPPVLNAVVKSADARLGGAVGAAVERTAAFDAMTDDLAAAMRALGRERVNRAFERVERMRLPLHGHGEGLIVVVAAYFALSHSRRSLPRRPEFWVSAETLRRI